MSKKQSFKKIVKKTLNFTFEKVIPSVISFTANGISKNLDRFEKNDKITQDQLDKFYEKSEKFYDAADKIYDASEYLNNKVNNSKFFNEEIKEDK